MNGKNEPLQFTRSDAERLIRIEEKLDGLNSFKIQTTKNSTAVKYLKWITGGLISGLIVIISILYRVM